jgi:hypothetical protein
MKTILGLLFLTQISFAASLNCVSLKDIYGWTGTETHEKMILKGELASDGLLKESKISGAYESDKRDLKVIPYVNKNPRYNNYAKFSSLEDAWNWFSILLPQNASSLTRPFLGYVQVVGEQGYKETVTLNCLVK